jgi:CHAT domain-containing protein
MFELDRPDKSGLVLVDSAKKIEILSLRDLSALDFRAVQHVTLSSCWSADNYVTPSRWVLSLPQTLCLAGARNVLGCLWELSDRRAALFMAIFYRQLRHLPLERALQAAQIAWIQRQRRRASSNGLDDPSAWAGFVLHSRTPGHDRLAAH